MLIEEEEKQSLTASTISAENHQNHDQEEQKTEQAAPAATPEVAGTSTDKEGPQENKAPKKPSATAAGTDASEKPLLRTIVDQDELICTEKEQLLYDADWSEFKEDVSMKTLVNTLDRAIKRRRRLYISDDPA